jgi:hypothetical protein
MWHIRLHHALFRKANLPPENSLVFSPAFVVELHDVSRTGWQHGFRSDLILCPKILTLQFYFLPVKHPT